MRALFSLIFLLCAVPAAAQQGWLSERPTFSCDRARSPIARIICSEKGGAEADWYLTAATWAARFSIPKDEGEAFDRAHKEWFQTVYSTCGLEPNAQQYQAEQAACVLKTFAERAAAYRAKLPFDAIVEANQTADERARIQDALIALGLLKGDADGQFGPNTREAIRKYQESKGRDPNKFLTQAERRELLTAAPQSVSAQRVSRTSPSSCLSIADIDERVACLEGNASRHRSEPNSNDATRQVTSEQSTSSVKCDPHLVGVICDLVGAPITANQRMGCKPENLNTLIGSSREILVERCGQPMGRSTNISANGVVEVLQFRFEGVAPIVAMALTGGPWPSFMVTLLNGHVVSVQY